MKVTRNIALILVLMMGLGSMTSCSTAKNVKKENTKELAGYTLKNKKELMQQKIARKKSKTVLATP